MQGYNLFGVLKALPFLSRQRKGVLNREEWRFSQYMQIPEDG